MKKYSPKLLKKSIGTQTERSVGTQTDVCKPILYPLQNSTTAIVVQNEIDMYDKSLWKTNSLPLIYVKLMPEKKLIHSEICESITRVQSDIGCINPMLTPNDFHEAEEKETVILAEDDANDTKEQTCMLSADEPGNHEIVLQENCISSVDGNKLKIIEKKNFIYANITANGNCSEQENCMSLIVDDSFNLLDQNDLTSANSEANNYSSEQMNCTSLAIDKIKPLDQNYSIFETNERNKSSERENCIEDYVPIWKSNTTPRQYRKTRIAGLSNIVNSIGSSADNEVCLSSTINDKPAPMDQKSLAFDDKIKAMDQNNSIYDTNGYNKSSERENCIEDYVPIWKSNTTPRQYRNTRSAGLSKILNAIGSSAYNVVCSSSTSNGKPAPMDQSNSISTIGEGNNESREMENCFENCELVFNKNATPRQYNESRGACFSKKVNAGSNRGNDKTKEWINLIKYREPMWKNNTTRRQYISPKGADLIQIGTSISNETKCVEKNNDHNYSMNVEKNSLKCGPINPTSNHDLTDLNLESSTVKTSVHFSQSNNSIITKNAQSPPDQSFNPGKGPTSMNRKRNVLGQVLMDSNKGDENVITIDLRIFMPNKVGKKYKNGEELNEIMSQPKADFDQSNAHIIKPKDGQEPKASIVKPNDIVKRKKITVRPNAEGKYVCGNCGKIYNIRRSFQYHMQMNNCNTCKKSYPCVWCVTEFKTKGELNIHEKRGCKPRPLSSNRRKAKERVDKLCEYCGKEFGCNASFYDHLQAHVNRKRYMCTACGKRFNKRGHLYSHEKSVHTKEKPWYNCTRCPHRSRLRRHIMEHEKIHDVPEGAEVPKPFKCHCGKGFISGHFLTNHKNANHKPKKCNMCGELLGNSKLLSEHKLSAHDVSESGKLNSEGTSTQTCPICAESFFGIDCKQKLDYHLDYEHNIAIGPGVRLSCDMCYYTFRLFASYILHKSTLHNVEVSESELRNMVERLSAVGEPTSAESSQLNGGLSKEVKYPKQSLEKVKKGITYPHKKPNCPICAKSYSNMKTFDCHLEAKHNIGNIGPGESLSCKSCGRTFKSFAWYIYHTSRIHRKQLNESELMSMTENLAWYKNGGIGKCERCDKKYASKRILRWHIRTEHPTESVFSCKACNVSFESRKEYYLHTSSAEHLPADKVSCNICHKKFKHTRSLWSHKIVHSTKPRIPCPDCVTKFKRKSDLTKHRRDKHKADTDAC